MGDLTPQQQRARRRRRLHERQAVVYGSLTAVLALAALGGAAVYTDAIELGFLVKDFTTVEAEPEAPRPPVPCLAESSLPVPYADIKVAVLNGSGRTGLASETANAVTTRGFSVDETGNSPERIDFPVQIAFGLSGLSHALTLAAHLSDPVLVLDTRDDPAVDLILGETFTGLVDPATVLLDPALPLLDAPDCVPAAEALEVAPDPREREVAVETTPEEQELQDGGEGQDGEAPPESTEDGAEG